MPALHTPIHEIPFVSVDVETTGLDPRLDQIIEIGAVKVINGQTIGEWDTLVSIDQRIPMSAHRVHGITDAMLAGKPTVQDAIRSLLVFAGDGTLVEHSHRAFDIAFLETAHGEPLPIPCLNTCTLSRKLFPFHRSHSLAECCRRYSIDNQNAHRALNDARATAQLLQHLLQACSARYPHFGDLLAVASVQR